MTPNTESPLRRANGLPRLPLNPIWLRELLQILRLRRTPLLLALLTWGVTVLVCSLGALSSLSQEPARIGAFLYQSFFSLAFLFVTWVGPGAAASLMASERSTTRWDTLLASGAETGRIARGLFAAALSYSVLCVLMISPLATLALLFGGVTPAEIGLGFLLVVTLASVAVGFGLSIGSATSSPTLALLLTAPVAALLSTVAYLGGIATSYLAAAQWAVVSRGTPLWLPTALSRAEVDGVYVLGLLVGPLGLMALTLWFLYEITVSNLSEPNQDRSSRVRYWFTVSSIVLYSAVSWAGLDRSLTHWIMLGLMMAMSLVGLCVFAGDDLIPSRRVQFEWQRRHASRWRRFFGPGVTKAALLVVLCATAGAFLLVISRAVQGDAGASSSSPRNPLTLWATSSYVVGFVAFLAGFTAFVRSRSFSGKTPRLLLGLLGLTVSLGPWLIAGATAAFGGFADDALAAIGAPSPLYVVAMIITSEDGSSSTPLLIFTGFVTALGWLVVGALLLWSAERRIRRQEALP